MQFTCIPYNLSLSLSLSLYAVFLTMSGQIVHLYVFESWRQKRTFGHVCKARIQTSLRIRAVWPESSMDAFRIASDAIVASEAIRNASIDNEEYADAHANLRLLWMHMSDGTFSRLAAHFVLSSNIQSTLVTSTPLTSNSRLP